MSDIVFVWGTRPEAIKITPVVRALRTRGVTPRLLYTGQHTSLLRGSPAETTLAESESLDLPSSGSVFAWINQARARFRLRYDFRDDIIVVQGDTMSAYVGAVEGAALGGSVAHIEAGVRSHGPEPWPEEDLRTAISEVALAHYPATETAFANLRVANTGTAFFLVTGNPIVSALADEGVVRASEPEPTVLITLHRRELRSRDDLGAILDELYFAMRQYPEIEFIWPVHPAMNDVVLYAGAPDNLSFIEPPGHSVFVQSLAKSLGVLTDSGGVVEEAATLGVPTAIFRTWNDRPEAVEAGWARQYRIGPEQARAAVSDLANDRIVAREPTPLPFGDDRAAERIADHLAGLVS